MITPHPGQQQVLQSKAKYNVVAKGRRWGATTLAYLEAERALQRDQHVTYLAYNHSMVDAAQRTFGYYAIHHQSEADFRGVHFMTARQFSGAIVWQTLIIDEAAYMDADWWTKEKRRIGWAERVLVLGTPIPRAQTAPMSALEAAWLQAVDAKNAATFRFPSSDAPHIGADGLVEVMRMTPMFLWRSEYLAEFVNVE